jgi:hypothetical protein
MRLNGSDDSPRGVRRYGGVGGKSQEIPVPLVFAVSSFVYSTYY